MSSQLASQPMSSVKNPLASIARRLSRGLGELGRDLFSGYHPERHYMRGPGPAWHAKHSARQATH